MRFVYLWLFVLLSCCYGFEFDFQIKEDEFQDDTNLPHVFNEKFEKLATDIFVDIVSIGSFTFEQLIRRIRVEWYPKIDNYFETAGLKRSDISFVQKAKINDLLKLMPRYNITDFWELPLKVLLNRVKFYMTEDGTKDMLDLLKEVYKTDKDAGVRIKSFQQTEGAAYMSTEYTKVLQLVKTIQDDETESLVNAFGLDRSKVTLVTQDSYDTINTKFSLMIFTRIHQDYNEMLNSQANVHEVLQKLRLYRESFYSWSQLCSRPGSSVPTEAFAEQNVQEITQRCFSQSFGKLSKDLYGVQISNSELFDKLNMQDIYHVLKTDEKSSLLNASTLIQTSNEKIEKFQEEKTEPFIMLALDKTLYPLEVLEKQKLRSVLPIIHDMNFDVLSKLYDISIVSSLEINHMPLGGLLTKLHAQYSNETTSKQQWRIVSTNTIMSALNGNLNKANLKKEVENAISKFSEYKIGDLQRYFPVTPLESKTLEELANSYLGLTSNEFFKLFNIPTKQQHFYTNAILSDIVLLSAPQANISRFSIKDLVDVTQKDFMFAEIMITKISEFKGNLSATVISKLSVTQLVENYANNNNITEHSFSEYIRKWSGSKELVTLLKIHQFEKILGIIQKKVDGVMDTRLLNILAEVLHTFGAPCDSSLQFCEANQNCVNGRCQCNDGYRFIENSKCANINECEFAQATCHEKATCRDTPGSYTCICGHGYHGDGSTCIDRNECELGTHDCNINAECINTDGLFACVCRNGFIGNGKTCTDIDECADVSKHGCHVNATCINHVGAYQCVCKSGFIGNGKSCDDVNECTAETDECKKNSKCRNTVGSYECDCTDNYIKTSPTKCLECTKDEMRNCPQNAECLYNQCICKTGYSTDQHDKTQNTCIDVDECNTASDICGYGHCINRQGSHTCVCDEGFQHSDDEDERTKCVDIDECKVATSYGKTLCPNKYQHCKNEFGSYACIRKRYFTRRGRQKPAERPNTELRIALGTSIPLIIILAFLMSAMFFLHRRMKGKHELRSFDDRLKAMYINRAFNSDTKSDVVSIISRKSDQESTIGTIPGKSTSVSSSQSSQIQQNGGNSNDDGSNLKRKGSLNNYYKKQDLKNLFKK